LPFQAIATVFTRAWQNCAQTNLSATRKYIMGTQNPQIISENIVLIADSNTWIEGNAIQQLQTTARLPQMRLVAGMPDLHAGRGYPVGAAFFSHGRFYPALIGNDIG